MILPMAPLAPLAWAVLLRCTAPVVPCPTMPLAARVAPSLARCPWPAWPPAPALRVAVAPSGRAHAFRPPLPADTPVTPTRAHASDRWFAEDKLKHFFVSFALGSIGYGSARAVGLRHGPAIAAASAGAIVVGAGKEVHDRATGGDFSLRDFTWDALGVVAAAGVSAETR